ncbi:hypothetical protein P8C59_001307 [Phyllachora maydis]|uniref:Ribosomal RNA-processing protein 8 n=1 Tax=Phyllachora maydis TaxID=1825666 RepID=A0AAD9HZA8_9PEZI|nr:hypothetical protein P8C59_001307 [Phyllachora maydis]
MESKNERKKQKLAHDINSNVGSVAPKKDNRSKKDQQKGPEAGGHETDDGHDANEEWAGIEDEPVEPLPGLAEPFEGKKQRKAKPKKQATSQDAPAADAEDSLTIERQERNGRKKEKRGAKSNGKSAVAEPEPTEQGKPQTAGTATIIKSPGAVNLTPLQASMREKLMSARFRHLNETLYTKPSAESFALFCNSPEMFDEYHQGFRRQVGMWPENPVDRYIADIKTRGKIRHLPKSGRGRFPEPSNSSVPELARTPLPRTDGTCTIVDLGCGDAALATALQPLQRKMNLVVKSYDLQSASPLVTRADIARLPLADSAADVALFCLALMGTNWVDFIEEAYRVLRWKGELWVAEIKSRFALPAGARGKAHGAVVEHSVGNRRRVSTTGKKKTGKDAAAAQAHEETAEETALAVEVDGVEDKSRATDVSAFVEVLRKRGFLLRGEQNEAVDMSNKMFVNMIFVKAAPAIKGGCAARGRDGGAQDKTKKRFIEHDDVDHVNEAAVLKPCVYKLR